ncbi:MAG: archaeosortase/exosortase family protein [Verrucomicrobiales bacterium]|nr:archaeosortase/exosortase family protein [Verrucomicrobiales bacterium]
MNFLNRNPRKKETGFRRPLIAHGAGVLFFLVGQFLGSQFPEEVLRVFAEPAGHLAAVFLNVPVDSSGEVIQLLHPQIDVAITDACSGFDFFCLIGALWVGWVVFSFRSATNSYLWILLILPMAWIITLVGNVSRIVCATQARLLTPESMGASFDGVIHQSVGVIVFLSVLILFWKTLTNCHERNCRA